MSGHLSGDGERLEEAAQSLERAADYASTTLPASARIWRKRAEDLRNLATRPSPTDSLRVVLDALDAAGIVNGEEVEDDPQELVEAIREFSRLSPENSSGVEEGLRERLLSDEFLEAGAKARYERRRVPDGFAFTWDEQAEGIKQGWRSNLACDLEAALASTQPVSPQPDPTTRLSEGTE